jgi:hypothetical protein
VRAAATATTTIAPPKGSILDRTLTNQYSTAFTTYQITYSSAPGQESVQEVMIDRILYKLLVFNVAKFMHQTGLLARFQHAEQEESDDEPESLAAMKQSP